MFIDNDYTGDKLTCIDVVATNKTIGYGKIFDLMHDLTDNGILDLYKDDRKKFLNFVISNFQRGEEKLIKSNLNPAFTTWLNNNR